MNKFGLKSADPWFSAPQHNGDLRTEPSQMVEVLYDAISLVHGHPELQFAFGKSGDGVDHGDDDNEDFDGDGQSQPAQQSKQQQEAPVKHKKSVYRSLHVLRIV